MCEEKGVRANRKKKKTTRFRLQVHSNRMKIVHLYQTISYKTSNKTN